MSERKAVIKNADMSEDMQQDAVDCATQALEKYNIEKDIAAFIKKEFDKKYNPTWHCIVGRNFGSYVTHETKHFIYFYLGQVAILLFKSGWTFFVVFTLTWQFNLNVMETIPDISAMIWLQLWLLIRALKEQFLVFNPLQLACSNSIVFKLF